MCYSSGSIDQAVNPCPMCRVYPHSKCPHIREICRNRVAHPRMDVLYLTNAEVESFNGCGFCKWADTNPPPHLAGYKNPGWPGCCRPPSATEISKIQAADWRAVNVIYKVPIPPEYEAILSALPSPSRLIAPSRTTPSKPSSPARRNTNTTPSKSNPIWTKTLTVTPQTRGRSPQGSPTVNLSRTSSSNAISSSVPTSSSIDSARRNKTSDRLEGTHSSNSSPSRRPIDLESSSTPRRVSSVRRPAVTPATTSVSISKVFAADTRSSRDTHPNRRSSISGTVPSPTSSSVPRSTESPLSFIVPRNATKDDDCNTSSSGGSSDGRDSLSDSTVTSEGGFTDYLSDESEAELQRQAEARAAVVAQNQAEELEFRIARQQLANVGLQPPKSWNPNNNTPTKKPSSPASRNNNVTSPSFAVAAAILHSGQAQV